MARVDVAAIKAAHPLAEVVARRYGLALRPTGGRRLTARCPLPGHERDRDPSFVVYAGQESFYCYGCGRGGDVITLVRVIEGLDFRTAVDTLTAGRPLPRAGAPSPRPAPRSPPRTAPTADPDAREALDLAVDYYARRLDADAAARAYLRARGLGPATIARRRLGLAGGLPDYIAWARLPRWPFFGAGLLHGDGRERLAGRVVVPELIDGRPTWLTGRLLPDTAADRPNVPRYESLPGPRPLLGLGSLPSGCDRALLVEGPFDWLVLEEWGYPALALGGSGCTREHLDHLTCVRRVGLLLDRDDAGARGTAHLAAALGDRAVVIALPEGAKDVADLAGWPDGRRRLAAALAHAGLTA